MSDRIKLAKAMGWTRIQEASTVGDCGRHTGLMGWPPNTPDGTIMDCSNNLAPLPDPFASADDDYACLEFAVKNIDPDKFHEALCQVVGSIPYLHEYRVGYWASALLRCLDG